MNGAAVTPGGAPSADCPVPWPATTQPPPALVWQQSDVIARVMCHGTQGQGVRVCRSVS